MAWAGGGGAATCGRARPGIAQRAAAALPAPTHLPPLISLSHFQEDGGAPGAPPGPTPAALAAAAERDAMDDSKFDAFLGNDAGALVGALEEDDKEADKVWVWVGRVGWGGSTGGWVVLDGTDGRPRLPARPRCRRCGRRSTTTWIPAAGTTERSACRKS